jgi:SAM-dependent methyltransferase
MMQAILRFIQETASEQRLPIGTVLEVGSRNINGSPRQAIGEAASSWHGVDLEPGPDVDEVLDAQELIQRFGLDAFDTVVCCECLEHTLHPWLIVEQMRSVLKPGGCLWISTPTFGFPLHRYPIDCYRFGEDAYRQVFYAGWEILSLALVEDGPGHPAIVAVGRKPGG